MDDAEWQERIRLYNEEQAKKPKPLRVDRPFKTSQSSRTTAQSAHHDVRQQSVEGVAMHQSISIFPADLLGGVRGALRPGYVLSGPYFSAETNITYYAICPAGTNQTIYWFGNTNTPPHNFVHQDRHGQNNRIIYQGVSPQQAMQQYWYDILHELQRHGLA